MRSADSSCNTTEVASSSYSSISMQLDGRDAVIVYREYDGSDEKLKYATCDLSASSNQSCSTPTEVASYSYSYISMQLDGRDVVIAYSEYDEGDYKLKYATCDLSASSNQCSTPTEVASSYFPYSSISMQLDGRDAVIVYGEYDGSDYKLKYATCDLSASSNQCSTPTDVASSYSYISMQLDGRDAVIAYSEYDGSDEKLKYATCDLSASSNQCSTPTEVASSSPSPSPSSYYSYSYSSISMQLAGRDAVIAYSEYDRGDYKLKYATCDLSASSNQCSTPTEVASSSSLYSYSYISMQLAGRDAVIAYSEYDGVDYKLKYATCDLSASSNQCSTPTEVASSSSSSYSYISMQLDGRDAVIVYSQYDESDEKLKYATCTYSPMKEPTGSPTTASSAKAPTIEDKTLGNKLDGPEGDVADLSSDLVNINNPIGDLNSTLLCLKKNLSAIFTEVDAFKAQIKNMDTDLTYLKSHTDFLKYDLSEVNQSLLDFINWQTRLHQCLAKSRTSWWHQRRCYRDYNLLNGATIGLLEDHQAAKKPQHQCLVLRCSMYALAFISGGAIVALAIIGYLYWQSTRQNKEAPLLEVGSLKNKVKCERVLAETEPFSPHTLDFSMTAGTEFWPEGL